MVHVVIIAHSELANSFLHCVEQIFSKKINYLHTVGVRSSDEADSILNKVQELINNLSINDDIDTLGLDNSRSVESVPDKFGSDVLILTDIFGATPHNIGAKLIEKNKIELITGLNLPMLIRAVSYAKDGLAICIQKALEGGVSGIIHLDNKESNGT
jgi:PTS system ascorbate-specific IIA component